jgi:hypothetical protein
MLRPYFWVTLQVVYMLHTISFNNFNRYAIHFNRTLVPLSLVILKRMAWQFRYLSLYTT